MTPPLRSLEAEYDHVSCLRESGRRAIHLLRDRISGRLVVLRICPQESEEGENEYAMLSMLPGPDVPAVYRCFSSDGQCFLLREYIEGETLRSVLKAHGPLAPSEAIALVRRLCTTLSRFHAHTPPIVHRDIKAENLILTPDRRLVLIDWGISRFYTPGVERDTQVLGTPEVAPPEQFGYCQTDPRSDVYAIGMLLRSLLGMDQPGVHVGPSLRRIVGRCLRFAPEDRYADAAALGRALARAAALRRAVPCAAAGLLAVGAVCAALPRLSAPVSPAVPSIRETAQAPLPSAAPPASLAKAPSARDGSQAVSFEDAALEAAVRTLLGKPEGALTADELAGIQSLILCGDTVYASFDQLVMSGNTLLVDGEPVAARGGVQTLSDLAMLPNLRSLALCSQQITDISPLAQLDLQYLALHDNAIRDLSPLSACASLQTLYIGENPVSDLSALAACPRLSQLYAVNTAMTSCASLAGLESLSLLHLFSPCALEDPDVLCGLPNLSILRLCPVSSAQLETLSRLSSLRFLYLWSVEGLTSLEPLSALTQLNLLFIDSPSLTSLDGISGLESLTSLSLVQSAVSDLSPLTQAFSIMELTFYDVVISDWSPLCDMPRLVRVTCPAPALEDILALGLDITVTVK